jgi:hypothetical protein
MADLAVLRIGDVGSFILEVELNHIGGTGLHTDLTTDAARYFINWHSVVLLIFSLKMIDVHNEYFCWAH